MTAISVVIIPKTAMDNVNNNIEILFCIMRTHYHFGFNLLVF
ncbi:hypothetical protein SAMN05421579_13918 [Xenorhabdus japonica]|uniref:Uncharacterized protein n=1 Tax=Xenorhabdus japonica TaxID=53341 RepID=A0A1I5DE67_9GAMM|nr:hypothetical protein SAMN05421579_13918 [Xenorhabdus japonica]